MVSMALWFNTKIQGSTDKTGLGSQALVKYETISTSNWPPTTNYYYYFIFITKNNTKNIFLFIHRGWISEDVSKSSTARTRKLRSLLQRCSRYVLRSDRPACLRFLRKKSCSRANTSSISLQSLWIKGEYDHNINSFLNLLSKFRGFKTRTIFMSL